MPVTAPPTKIHSISTMILIRRSVSIGQGLLAVVLVQSSEGREAIGGAGRGTGISATEPGGEQAHRKRTGCAPRNSAFPKCEPVCCARRIRPARGDACDEAQRGRDLAVLRRMTSQRDEFVERWFL